MDKMLATTYERTAEDLRDARSLAACDLEEAIASMSLDASDLYEDVCCATQALRVDADTALRKLRRLCESQNAMRKWSRSNVLYELGSNPRRDGLRRRLGQDVETLETLLRDERPDEFARLKALVDMLDRKFSIATDAQTLLSNCQALDQPTKYRPQSLMRLVEERTFPSKMQARIILVSMRPETRSLSQGIDDLKARVSSDELVMSADDVEDLARRFEALSTQTQGSRFAELYEAVGSDGPTMARTFATPCGEMPTICVLTTEGTMRIAVEDDAKRRLLLGRRDVRRIKVACSQSDDMVADVLADILATTPSECWTTTTDLETLVADTSRHATYPLRDDTIPMDVATDQCRHRPKPRGLVTFDRFWTEMTPDTRLLLTIARDGKTLADIARTLRPLRGTTNTWNLANPEIIEGAVATTLMRNPTMPVCDYAMNESDLEDLADCLEEGDDALRIRKVKRLLSELPKDYDVRAIIDESEKA